MQSPVPHCGRSGVTEINFCALISMAIAIRRRAFSTRSYVGIQKEVTVIIACEAAVEALIFSRMLARGSFQQLHTFTDSKHCGHRNFGWPQILTQAQRGLA